MCVLIDSKQGNSDGIDKDLVILLKSDANPCNRQKAITNLFQVPNSNSFVCHLIAIHEFKLL